MHEQIYPDDNNRDKGGCLPLLIVAVVVSWLILAATIWAGAHVNDWLRS